MIRVLAEDPSPTTASLLREVVAKGMEYFDTELAVKTERPMLELLDTCVGLSDDVGDLARDARACFVEFVGLLRSTLKRSLYRVARFGRDAEPGLHEETKKLLMERAPEYVTQLPGYRAPPFEPEIRASRFPSGVLADEGP